VKMAWISWWHHDGSSMLEFHCFELMGPVHMRTSQPLSERDLEWKWPASQDVTMMTPQYWVHGVHVPTLSSLHCITSNSHMTFIKVTNRPFSVVPASWIDLDKSAWS
jgi:hypothetical protein